MTDSEAAAGPSRRIRRPAVAGMFYPADPAELRGMVQPMLDRVPPSDRVPKAIIAPHAGYMYSGPVAAQAYAQLRAGRGRIRRVILLGPAHRVYVRGLALPGDDQFATPLGLVDIDTRAADRIRHLPQVRTLDAAHAEEHSLEVHLPFLQSVLERFELVPLVVGEATPAEVAEVLDLLWGGEETLIVISSDLSHYLDYDAARARDSRTADSIRSLQLEAIGPYEACGCMPLHGLLSIARQRGLRIELLDLRNSGDTAGPRDRVVGYGSFSVWSPEALQADHKRSLLEVARASIRAARRVHHPGTGRATARLHRHHRGGRAAGGRRCRQCLQRRLPGSALSAGHAGGICRAAVVPVIAVTAGRRAVRFRAGIAGTGSRRLARPDHRRPRPQGHLPAVGMGADRNTRRISPASETQGGTGAGRGAGAGVGVYD